MNTSHYILAVVSSISFFTGQAGAQTGPLDQWTGRNSGTTGHLLAIAYGNGTFVAVGGLPPFSPSDPIHPSLLSSTNGIIWNSLPMPTNANFYGVSFVNNRFIAVGNSGLIMSSEDAVSWTLQKSSAANQTSDIYPLGGVAFGNGTYVAMDRLLGNSCLVSTDATNWTAKVLQPGNNFVEMDRVHLDNGLFIACGVVNNAALLTSTNGLNWTVRISPLSGNGLNDTAYGGGRWVGVGDLAAVSTSTDGITWTAGKVPTPVSQAHINLHGVTYAEGFFVAVGDSGTVLSSADGVNWSSRASAGTAALNAIAFGNGSLVSVGLSGAIWQSGPFLHLAIARQPEGASLILSSPTGAQVLIQASTDLVNWTDLFSVPATQTTQSFLDTNAQTIPYRLYRAVAH